MFNKIKQLICHHDFNEEPFFHNGIVIIKVVKSCLKCQKPLTEKEKDEINSLAKIMNGIFPF